MNKATEIKVEITAKIGVDKESAERCLEVLEWYCNDNNVFPLADRDPDGTLHFRFETDFGRRVEK